MKNIFLILIFFIIISCKSDYEKALHFINEKDYEKATLYLNTIDSGEENYSNARLKLKEIEKTINSVAFNNAIQAFKQKNYEEAELLFTGFGTSSVHFQEAQKYLVMIKVNLLKESLPNDNINKKESVELKLAKKNVIRLYKELLEFKDKPDFYEYGFAVGYKYNRWLMEVEEIRNNKEITHRLYDDGYPVIDLMQMGQFYRGSAGKETEFTKYAKKRWKAITKISR